MVRRKIGRGKPSKPGPSRRELDFRDRQREKEREKYFDPRMKKAEEKPIEVKPFKEIPEIQSVNLPDYWDVSHLVNGVFRPARNLEKAVSCLMINLLLSHSDIYQPGKSYSKTERQYTREQLRIFRDALSAEEVVFDIRHQSGVGRFEKGGIYRARDLKTLIENDFWIMEGLSFDIVYLRDPSGIIPKEGSVYAEDVAEAIVWKRHRERFEEKIAYFSGIDAAKEKRLTEYLESQNIKTDKTMDEKSILRKLRQYLSEDQDMSDELKDILTKVIEAADFQEQIEREVQEEMKNLPDEAGIAARLSKNINPNGILIVEGNVDNIPGLRLVDSYDEVRLYQKN